MTYHDDEILRARIPANVDQSDKIAWGLTARQLAILTGTTLMIAAIYVPLGGRVPLAVIAAMTFPVAAIGIAVALGRRDGLTLDRYVLAALDYLRLPRRRVNAPEGVPPLPSWCRLRGRLPAPLDLPVRAIRTDGVMELSGGGTAVLVECSTVSFSLRTGTEQAALVASFARWLNTLDSPVQVLVRARSADLSGLISAVEEQAPALPHPALEEAARDHAGYLAQISDSRELLYRQVLLVITGKPLGAARRTASRDACAEVTVRRGEEAERVLAALGVRVEVLDAGQTMATLAECLAPGAQFPGSAPAGPGESITTYVAPA